MAESLTSLSGNIKKWIHQYPGIFSFIDAKSCYCNVCEQVINCVRKSHITQHVGTKRHQCKLNPDLNFNAKLCEAFVAANIPLSKIENPVLKNFLETFTGHSIPCETTLRSHITQTYTKVMDTIKSKVEGKYIWVSADETCDIKGRCVTNVIIGVLDPNKAQKPYLISTKIQERVNAEYIAKVIADSMEHIFGTDRSNYIMRILLFVSDAAAYMVKAGKLLKSVYPNMLHVTCIAHGLHRICEFIRDEFQTTDRLISLMKKIFLKAPLRVRIYREKCPDLPLPPSPVITRWGTWLDASMFYAENLEMLNSVIPSLDDDAKTISQCKEIIRHTNLIKELEYIKVNFDNLSKGIKYFENQNLKLEESLNTLNSILRQLKNLPGYFGPKLATKIDAIFKRNPDIHILQQFFDKDFDLDLQIKYYDLLPYYNYAPITSCDVERSFSKFNDVFTSKRTNFTHGNLEKVMIIYANSSLLLEN